MNLNHVNLVVNNVDEAVKLFSGIFDFKVIVNRNSKMAVLENDSRFIMVIWGQVLNKEDGIPHYPKNFHIGFYQENEDDVKALYEKLLKVENLTFESEPKKLRDTFGFYFYFESLMIEISVNNVMMDV